MKHRVVVFLLAFCLSLSLLPLTARAEQNPQEGGYQISARIVGGQGCGRVELYTDRARAGETVYVLADPDDGYLAQIAGDSLKVSYVGLDLYAVTMPEGDLTLEIRFVPAGGELYAITGTVNDSRWGELTISRTSAREGEAVVVRAVPGAGCVLTRLTVLGTDGGPVRGGYLDTRDGVQIYEYQLPNAGLVIEAEFAQEVQDNIPWQGVMTREELRSLLGRLLDPGFLAELFHTAFPGG